MTDEKAFNPADYWEKRLSENPNIRGVGFISFSKTFNDWMYRVRKTVFDRTVKATRLNTKTAKVLDAGSGTGFYIERWSALGVTDLRYFGRRYTGICLRVAERTLYSGKTFFRIGAQPSSTARRWIFRLADPTLSPPRQTPPAV